MTRENFKQVRIKLPESVWEELKEESKAKGRTLKAHVGRTLRTHVNREEVDAGLLKKQDIEELAELLNEKMDDSTK